MKIKLIGIIIVSIALSAVSFAKGSSRSGGYVKGYTRKDGTYVSGYTRGTGSVSSFRIGSGSSTTSTSTTPQSNNDLKPATSGETQKIIDEANKKLAEQNKKS